MKKHLLAMLFALFGHTAHAQTPPVTVFVEWDPPALDQTIQHYNAYLDTAPVVSVPITTDPSCSCVKFPITVATGPHTVKVTAVYLLLTGDPTSTTEGPPATVTFAINNGDVKNIKVRTK